MPTPFSARPWRGGSEWGGCGNFWQAAVPLLACPAVPRVPDHAARGARLVQQCRRHGWTSQPWHPSVQAGRRAHGNLPAPGGGRRRGRRGRLARPVGGVRPQELQMLVSEELAEYLHCPRRPLGPLEPTGRTHEHRRDLRQRDADIRDRAVPDAETAAARWTFHAARLGWIVLAVAVSVKAVLVPVDAQRLSVFRGGGRAWWRARTSTR